MGGNILFEKRLGREEIEGLLRNIEFRGLYDENGNKLKPYRDAKFSLVKVHPPSSPTTLPQVIHDNNQPQPLFTAQPTIYKRQTDMLRIVDDFLKTQNTRIHRLGFEGFQYQWEKRGRFHVLPPVIEKHSYPLSAGKFDIDKIKEKFAGTFVKDARGNLHELSKRTIRDYYVDPDSKIRYLEVFNSNAELINYGLRFNGPSEFLIICDGSHRMDLAIELLNEPINVLLVESPTLTPYYAFPMPFMPITRLTSKDAERMYPRLERDKVHLLNDVLKKVLHYDWEAGGLHVSELRGQAKIY